MPDEVGVLKGNEMKYTDHFSTDELRMKLVLYRRVLDDTTDALTVARLRDGIAVIERVLSSRGEQS